MKRLGLSSVLLLVVLYGLWGLGFAEDSPVFTDGGFAEPADFGDDGRDFGPFPVEQRPFTAPEQHRAMDRRLFASDGLTIEDRVTQAENEEMCIRQQEVMPDGLHASVSREWLRRYGKKGMGEDHAVGVVVDASGNTYVTGTSKAWGTASTDIATIKYDPDGKVLWNKRYNGTGNGSDGAAAIAVDGNGNVYVTGESDRDYLTIKYAQ